MAGMLRGVRFSARHSDDTTHAGKTQAYQAHEWVKAGKAIIVDDSGAGSAPESEPEADPTSGAAIVNDGAGDQADAGATAMVAPTPAGPPPTVIIEQPDGEPSQ